MADRQERKRRPRHASPDEDSLQVGPAKRATLYSFMYRNSYSQAPPAGLAGAMNARPSRPTRLVAIGLNRRDAKSAKVGALYQVDASRLPWPCASWSESERAPGTLIPRAAVEVEIARSTAATLTAIAYAGALPTADEDAAEEEPPDGWEWKLSLIHI